MKKEGTADDEQKTAALKDVVDGARPPAPGPSVSHDAMMLQHLHEKNEEQGNVIKTLNELLNRRSQEIFDTELKLSRSESTIERLQLQVKSLEAEIQRRTETASQQTSATEALEQKEAEK